MKIICTEAKMQTCIVEGKYILRENIKVINQWINNMHQYKNVCTRFWGLQWRRLSLTKPIPRIIPVCTPHRVNAGKQVKDRVHWFFLFFFYCLFPVSRRFRHAVGNMYRDQNCMTRHFLHLRHPGRICLDTGTFFNKRNLPKSRSRNLGALRSLWKFQAPPVKPQGPLLLTWFNFNPSMDM